MKPSQLPLLFALVLGITAVYAVHRYICGATASGANPATVGI